MGEAQWKLGLGGRERDRGTTGLGDIEGVEEKEGSGEGMGDRKERQGRRERVSEGGIEGRRGQRDRGGKWVGRHGGIREVGEAHKNGGRREVGIGGQVSRKACRE